MITKYTTELQKPGKLMMLENPEGTRRYEFSTYPVYKSNLDHTVAYYRPQYKYCQRLVGGSTCSYSNTSKEKGNELYKKLIADGWHKVDFDTRSFA